MPTLTDPHLSLVRPVTPRTPDGSPTEFLTVTVPKAEAAKPRMIEITG